MKTLAEKIAVMQAAMRDETIEVRSIAGRGCQIGSEWETANRQGNNIIWDWWRFDYRVAPKPREYWIAFYIDGEPLVCRTKEEVDQCSRVHRYRTAHVRTIEEL